jgi:branched-chain amino acid transport system permease protein
MVLAAEPAVIFLDEPTAGLSPADRLRTGEVLLALVREHGIGLLLIEHDLDFVKSVAERLTVLSNGRVLADGLANEVVSDARVQQVYLGHRPKPAKVDGR